MADHAVNAVKRETQVGAHDVRVSPSPQRCELLVAERVTYATCANDHANYTRRCMNRGMDWALTMTRVTMINMPETDIRQRIERLLVNDKHPRMSSPRSPLWLDRQRCPGRERKPIRRRSLNQWPVPSPAYLR